MLKKKKVQPTCRYCGEPYNEKKVRRQFGLLPMGYDSAYCYTQHMMYKESKVTPTE